MKKKISILLSVIMLFSAVWYVPVTATGDETTTGNTADSEPLPSFSDKTAALKYIRAQMKDRVGEIEFLYSGDALTQEDIVTYSKSAADEGDYLRFLIEELTIDDTGTSLCLHVTYHTDAAQEQAVNEAVTQALQDVNLKSLSAYQKALFVFDLLCDQVAYADDESDADAYSAYGALVNHRARCQGYALAYYRLARAMGLDCRIIVGDLEEENDTIPHAWNAVKIDSKWYYVDATNGAAASRRYAMFMMPLDCGAFSLCPQYQAEAEMAGTLFLTADEVGDYSFQHLLSGKCDTTVSWELEPLTGILRITGTGDMAAFPANNLRWRKYSELITDAYISDTVTSVCDDCFAGCNLILHCTENSAAHLYAQNNMPEQFHLLTVKDAVPATCVAPGNKEGLMCEICDVVFDGNEIVPVSDDHVDVNADDVCDRCEARLNYDATGCCGDTIHWYYYNSGELLLQGVGEMYDYSSTKSAPWKSKYAKTIKTVTVLEGITSIGKYAFNGCVGVETISLPDSVASMGAYAFNKAAALQTINIPNAVTAVPNYAFNGCSSLTEITLPSTVTSIGNNAFCDCTSLQTINIPNVVTAIPNNAFKGCTALETITLPPTVTSIGNSAFDNCTSLSEIQLPPYLSSLGSYAMRNTSVRSVIIPKSLTKAGSNGGAFAGSALEQVEFEAGTKSIPDRICQGAANLTAIDFSDEETAIGAKAFWGCTALTDVTIPSTVTVIYSHAFSNTGIKHVAIPKSVVYTGITKQTTLASNGIFVDAKLETIEFESGMTKIPNSVCKGAKCLTDVTIPDSVATIGEYAFSNCTGLTEFDIPSSVTAIYNGAFNGSGIREMYFPKSVAKKGVYLSGLFENSALEKIEFEEGTEKLYDSICKNAKNLRTVVLPDTVTQIGIDAFYGCTGLTEIDLPDHLTKIDVSAFSGSALTSVVIPDSVTTIGGSAFSKCSSLADIRFSEGLKTIDNEAFSYTPLQSVILPESLKKIGSYVFRNCSSLTSVLIPSYVTTVGTDAFKGCPENLVIHCPAGSNAGTYAADQAIDYHTDYETDEVSLRYCSGEEHVAVVAYCNECGKMITPDGLFDAQGHVVVADKGTPAKCTEPGLTAGSHCGVCLQVLEALTEIPATGHTEAEIAAKEPTCTLNGNTTGVKCGVCGTVLVAPEVIPKTGHTYVTDEAVTATCTTDGLTEGKHCSVCGHKNPSQKTVPATGHQDTMEEGERADGICDICGERMEENFIQRIIHRIGRFFEGLSRFLKNLFKRRR